MKESLPLIQVTALESIVKTYIILYTNKKGISKSVETGLISQNLSFLVTVILKIFVNSDKLTDELISDIATGIKLRNKIIHKSFLEISKRQAEQILQNVKAVAKYCWMILANIMLVHLKQSLNKINMDNNIFVEPNDFPSSILARSKFGICNLWLETALDNYLKIFSCFICRKAK